MYTPVNFYKIKNMAKDVKSLNAVMYILGSGSRAEVLDKVSTSLLMADFIRGKYGTVSLMDLVN